MGRLRLALAMLVSAAAAAGSVYSINRPSGDLPRSLERLADATKLPEERRHVITYGREVAVGHAGLPNGDGISIYVERITDRNGRVRTSLDVGRSGPADGDAIPIVWTYGRYTIPNEEFDFQPDLKAKLETVVRGLPLSVRWTADSVENLTQPYMLVDIGDDARMVGKLGAESFSGESSVSIQLWKRPLDKPAPKRPTN